MMIRNFIILLLIISSIVLSTGNLHAENIKQVPEEQLIVDNQVADSLNWSIEYLNKLLYSKGEWYLTDHSYKKPIRGILNYAENDPLDTAIVDVRKFLNDKKVVFLMDRRPQDIRNVKEINGYISDDEIQKGIEDIKKRLLDSLNLSNIVLPTGMLDAELSMAPQVPDGNPADILVSKRKDLPSEFVANLNRRMAAMHFATDMSDKSMDTIRYQLFKTYRQVYNDSVMNSWRERITYTYKNKYITEQSDLRIKAYKKLVKEKNLAVLTAYNDQAVSAVNDSLKIALQYLTAHAEADSSLIRLLNLKNEKTELWTANREMRPIRMFLKNAQNDSLSVVLISNRKGELQLVIDDAIKLTRVAESQNRTVTFQTKAPDRNLKKVKLHTIVYPAWTFIGNGSVGFTQTSLSNWSAGGESAMALLIMSKYNANYSKDKVRWESNAEFRYGISQTKTRGFEKNDDKIEFQTRFGYSAFKKWFYSGEANFRTQIAKGYTFPDKTHPISAFMAPGYLTMSLGFDYKPNKDFSLFISPFTSKTTYIRDTAMIAPSKFGLEPGTKKLWEPGIIVKANWHRVLAENITYDTRAEFFNNYRYTFQKFAFLWEQVVIMKVNRSINARVMTQLVYDYNTKFPIRNSSGVVIGQKPKWQFKELLTIGLAYRF